MKKILLACSAAAILFITSNGCKEIGPNINLSTATATDSPFTVSPVPAAQAHNVLVEDFSGQHCSNCPSAHTAAENAAKTSNGHVNIITYYYNISSQADPIAGSSHDFRDTVAASRIDVQYYNGVSDLPHGGIDRIPNSSGSLAIDYTTWPGVISGRLNPVDSVNLTVTSSWDALAQKATIKATVVYLYPNTFTQNLSVIIVEDSMVDRQSDGIRVDTFYMFTDVFRAMVTNIPSGDPILPAMTTKAAGQADMRTYTYTPAVMVPAIDPKHCRVIAFVNSTNGTDQHILQSTQAQLAP